MSIDNEIKKSLRERTGMIPLKTDKGIQALYRGLASGKDNVTVLEGEIDILKKKIIGEQFQKKERNETTIIKKDKSVPIEEESVVQEKAENYFKKLLSEIIKLPPQKIESDALMEKYGIDSIMAMKLITKLEGAFGSLSKTLFFEYKNIYELTGYFLEVA